MHAKTVKCKYSWHIWGCSKEGRVAIVHTLCYEERGVGDGIREAS